MWGSNCNDGKSKKLCPVCLGLAIGIVCFFGSLIWALWAMHYGMPTMMEAVHMSEPTLQSAFVRALLCLIKGFIGGFFVALLYNMFACRCPCKGCKCDEKRGV